MTGQDARGSAAVAALQFLGSPRLTAAMTTATLGTGVLAEALQRTIGWPGYLGILVVLVLLWVASTVVNRDTIEWQGLLPISLLAFVGWACGSILWSQYQWASLGGITYLLVFTLFGVSIALTRDTIQIVRAFGDVFRVVLAASIAIEIISGVLIDTPIEFLGIEGNLAHLGPIQGLMGSRNQVGLLAMLALITFAIEWLTKSIDRWLVIGSMVGAAAVILLSRSPVIWAVSVVVAIAVLALAALRRVPAERRTVWQLVIVAAVVVLTGLAWVFRSWIILLFAANSELSYRLALWNGVFDVIGHDYTVQGWGWIGIWRPEMPPFTAFAGFGQRDPTSALNAYLDVWFQLGLVGAFVFAVLVVLTFTRSWLLAGRKRNIVFAWPALVLIALLVTNLAESSLLIEYGWLTFVVCSVKAARELSWRRAFAAPIPQDHD